jgi:hypothetical protein
MMTDHRFQHKYYTNHHKYTILGVSCNSFLCIIIPSAPPVEDDTKKANAWVSVRVEWL